ncbi:MAG: hypothetical protein V4466_05170, partial [Pseudomonadota bacterium]
MPRVIFVADYIYTPTLERRVSTKFKSSPHPRLVNQDCADKAIAVGRARLADANAARAKAPGCTMNSARR